MVDYTSMAIGEIKNIVSELSLDDQVGLIEILEADDRKGVVSLVKKIKKTKEKYDAELLRIENMKLFEKSLNSKKINLIAGIDEVGRGPLAGPVVTAAVILPEDYDYIGINDSKKVPLKRREELYEEIISTAVDYSFGSATCEEIDRLNILGATKLAMKRAVEGLKIKPEHLLIDAVELADINIEQTSLIKGDERSVSIAAASILAKVKRDRLMVELAGKYPGYGFENNKGYGTSEHYKGLNAQGITEIHRRTFVKDFL